MKNKNNNYFHYYKSESLKIISIAVLVAIIVGVAVIMPLSLSFDSELGTTMLIVALFVFIGIAVVIERRYYKSFSPSVSDPEMAESFAVWYNRFKSERRGELVAKKIPRFIVFLLWMVLIVFAFYILFNYQRIDIQVFDTHNNDTFNQNFFKNELIRYAIFFTSGLFLIILIYAKYLDKPTPWHGEKYSLFAKNLIFKNMLGEKFEALLGNGAPLKIGGNLSKDNPIYLNADKCYFEMVNEKDLNDWFKGISEDDKKATSDAINQMLKSTRENGGGRKFIYNFRALYR